MYKLSYAILSYTSYFYKVTTCYVYDGMAYESKCRDVVITSNIKNQGTKGVSEFTTFTFIIALYGLLYYE